MNIVTVVQARMGSSRMPGKVMMPLVGKPLILRMLERVCLSNLTGQVIVAVTDEDRDNRLAETCEAAGYLVYRGSTSDLLDRHYKTGLKYNADAVVKIPSDCPLIDPLVITKVLSYFISNDGKYDYVSNLHPATYPDGNDVEIMTMKALEESWREASRDLEREHTTPYIWENPDKFKIGNVLWETGLDYSMSHRWTIDYMEDYLFLSKGHDVPALYGTLAELGIIEKERLKNHLKTNDFIYWHPNTRIPGIEYHSGSLGHLLSVSMGVAKDCLLKNQDNKVVVILGDGELNEGSVWEGLLVASAHKLNNMVAVVDRNQFQANIRTEELIPIEPLEKKFESFGWTPYRCNGHDFDDLEKTFSKLPFRENRPSVIIAETIRGKGLPSIESRADRWFCNFTHDEIDHLLQELHSKVKTDLKSETLTVR